MARAAIEPGEGSVKGLKPPQTVPVFWIMPPASMILKASLMAAPKSELVIEGFSQMRMWRDLVPAGHVQRKKMGTKASVSLPAVMVRTPRSSDSLFSAVFSVKVRSSSMTSVSGPRGWWGETPGGSCMSGVDAMVVF